MTDTRMDLEGCLCPGAPHESDWLELAPEATLEIGVAANYAIASHGDDPMALRVALAKAYTRYGITAWNRTDKAINHDANDWPATVDEWLPWQRALLVAERGDALYSKAIFDPLAKRLASFSPPGQTDNSTSPTPSSDSGPTLPTPSEPSSDAPTDGPPSEDPTA